ncbi:MAG: hypothetical protein FWH22_03805 [Fibromonadales bacterium]|nr:hypothetical protein [Fibromonadales bacterium]
MEITAKNQNNWKNKSGTSFRVDCICCKTLAIVLATLSLLFAQTQIWDGNSDIAWYNDDDTEFVINTAEQLAGLAELVNDDNDFDGKTITLGANIQLNDTTGWQNWASEPPENEWTAIGSSNPFRGTFDGNGYVISGVYINNSDSRQSLFGNVSGGTIKNLGVLASYIKGGGGLVGSIYSHYDDGDYFCVTISNSYAIANVEGTYYVGGLVGYSSGSNNCNNIISDSRAMGNVTGENGSVGGLVGYNYYSTITNSYATGNVTGNSDVSDSIGGLVGYIEYSTITSSYATGKVTGNSLANGSTGGLVGSTYSSTITSSYATGNVTGKVTGPNNVGAFIGNNNVGGFVGYNNYNSTIANSYATGSVTGYNNVGGFVGTINNSTIANSYAAGSVTGNYNVGGFVGTINNSTTTNSFYDRNSSGQNSSSGGIGKTAAEMRNKSTYAGWDFSIWGMSGELNDGLPFLNGLGPISQVQIDPIEPQLYTGFQIKPKPAVTIKDETLEAGVDFDYFYDENIHVATGGTIFIAGKKDKYHGIKAVNFIIKPARIIDIAWFPKCGAIYTYNGELQSPEPFAVDANGIRYDLIVEGAEKNAGIGLVAIAKLETQEEDMILQNSACLYAIEPKELQVSWTGPREYTYSKMVQTPTPSIDQEELLDEIDFIFGNYNAAAGEYKGSQAAYYIINPEDPNAGNYRLLNNRAEYTIHKKPLKPFFAATLPNFETNENDTLWVPKEIFSTPDLLQTTLAAIINYSGFATNTETNETDNPTNSLNGTPKIELSYDNSQFSTLNSQLSKRVETSQRATATIITDGISADNYALTRPAIVIMETIDESEAAVKVSCFLGSHCAELSEQVCAAIKGEEVPSCPALRVSCLINNVKVENMLLTECSSIGGFVEGSTSIFSNRENPGISSTLCTGVACYAPTYYNLKGIPLGAQKPTAPGIYIEKQGKYMRKIVVK